MFELFARAFNLGLVATIMPGPLQTLASNSALSHAWRKSLLWQGTSEIVLYFQNARGRVN